MLEYKGYYGEAVFDNAAGIFHGEVVGTRDVITFQGETISELESAFSGSIDEYLKFCAQRGQAPDSPKTPNG